MENKQRIPGAVGPSYTLRSERFDCQETINFYLEMDELGAGNGNEPMVLMPTPGLNYLQTVGTGPIRCLYTQSDDNISYVVSGNEVYQISGALGAPVIIAGNLNTSTGPVQATDNGTSVLFVDGTDGYYTDIGSEVLNTISSPNFFPTDTITFQDGYFIGVQKGTQAFFISDINAVTFPPLNEAYAQGSPDVLIAAISNNRQLYLLGAKSLETWWDAGQSSSTPFQRQDGRFSQYGCTAPASIAVLQETFFWLGSNAQGGGVVYYLNNGMPTRVSTHAVEYEIQNAGTLTASTAFAYQQEGHYFYCLNIPGLNYTWVYDMATGQWHKRQSDDHGNKVKSIGQTHCVLNGSHLIGDATDGNLYEYDLNVWTENGNPIYRTRVFPHQSNNRNMVFYKLLEVYFQSGVGLPNPDTTIDYTLGVNPRAMLYCSRDGGETWGLPIMANLGQIGKYDYRARWNRLGRARDMVFKIVLSEPVRVVMLSAYVDMEVGEA